MRSIRKRSADVNDLSFAGASDFVGARGDPVLSIRNLTVQFKTAEGIVHAVDDLNFDLHTNHTLGIVGESGSGKSVTAMAILGLLPKSANVHGQVIFDGDNLVGATERQLQPVRGDRIAMVFQ